MNFTIFYCLNDIVKGPQHLFPWKSRHPIFVTQNQTYNEHLFFYHYQYDVFQTCSRHLLARGGGSWKAKRLEQVFAAVVVKDSVAALEEHLPSSFKQFIQTISSIVQNIFFSWTKVKDHHFKKKKGRNFLRFFGRPLDKFLRLCWLL